jgi:hypothetical protein
MILSTSSFLGELVFFNKITIIIREKDLISLPDISFCKVGILFSIS